MLCDVLLLMGCCVGGVWCCCYELCGCVNGASPVGFVLWLFYLCAFQMNPVCVVCLFVVIRVTRPNDWSEWGCMFVCVCRRARI